MRSIFMSAIAGISMAHQAPSAKALGRRMLESSYDDVKKDFEEYLVDDLGFYNEWVEDFNFWLDEAYSETVLERRATMEGIEEMILDANKESETYDENLLKKLFSSEQWLAIEAKADDLFATEEWKRLQTWPDKFKTLRETPEWKAVFNKQEFAAFWNSSEFQALWDWIFDIDRYQAFLDDSAVSAEIRKIVVQLEALMDSSKMEKLTDLTPLKTLTKSAEWKAVFDMDALQALVKTPEFKDAMIDPVKNGEALMKTKEFQDMPTQEEIGALMESKNMEEVMKYEEKFNDVMDSDEMAELADMSELEAIAQTEAFAKVTDIQPLLEPVMQSAEFQALNNEEEQRALMELDLFNEVFSEKWINDVENTTEFYALADEQLWMDLMMSEEFEALQKESAERQVEMLIEFIEEELTQEKFDETVADTIDRVQQRLTRVRTYPYTETYDDEGIQLEEMIEDAKEMIRDIIRLNFLSRAKTALWFIIVVYILIPLFIAVIVVVLVCCCLKRKRQEQYEGATTTGK